MGGAGAERQQRLFLLAGRPGAGVVAFVVFGLLYLLQPSPELRHFLILLVAFTVTTIPLGWIAPRWFPVRQVALVMLVIDIVMVSTFTWALDHESLLVVPYFAPVAFAALMFGPVTTLGLTLLALLGSGIVAGTRDFDAVTVAGNLVVLFVTGLILTGLSREVQRAQRSVRRERELDTAALRIGDAMRDAAGANQVLERAVEELGRSTDAARCLIRRPHPNALVLQWTRDGVEPLASTETPPLVARVADVGRPLIASVDDSELADYLSEASMQSLLAAPLFSHGRVLAVIALHDDRGRDWSHALALVERVAPQVAAGLAQADLFDEREQLIANVSHELRTPLTATIGFLRTLERNDVELDARQRDEFIAVARREAERLGRLVGDLLQLTRLDRGQISLTREPTELHALLERAASQLEVPEGRAIRIEHVPELRASVDPDRMLQVFSNLLGNAIRHGAGDVDVSGGLDNGRLQIAVTDAGGGVPDANVDAMFLPFARWSRHRDSSGLGLAIARRLVEAHEGRLTYRRREGDLPHAFVVELPRD